MPSWAKVVARWMGCTTAPVEASGPWPTWMARVAKPALRSVTSAMVGDVLEQVGARDHADGAVAVDDGHRGLAVEQRREGLVDRRVGRDNGEGRVHGRGHRRRDHRGVAVHAVEEGALGDAAHHRAVA